MAGGGRQITLILPCELVAEIDRVADEARRASNALRVTRSYVVAELVRRGLAQPELFSPPPRLSIRSRLVRELEEAGKDLDIGALSSRLGVTHVGVRKAASQAVVREEIVRTGWGRYSSRRRGGRPLLVSTELVVSRLQRLGTTTEVAIDLGVSVSTVNRRLRDHAGPRRGRYPELRDAIIAELKVSPASLAELRRRLKLPKSAMRTVRRRVADLRAEGVVVERNENFEISVG